MHRLNENSSLTREPIIFSSSAISQPTLRATFCEIYGVLQMVNDWGLLNGLGCVQDGSGSDIQVEAVQEHQKWGNTVR